MYNQFPNSEGIVTSVSFSTPISFKYADNKTKLQSCQEFVEDYFYLSGKKAYVIPADDIKKDQVRTFILDGKTSSNVRTALKIASYCTLVIPLLFLLAKAGLRLFGPSYQVIDPQQNLEEGIEITDEIRDELATHMSDILFKTQNEKINRLHDGNNKIFTLQSSPNIVFKTQLSGTEAKYTGYGAERMLIHDLSITDNAMTTRYDNVVEAEKVCLLYNLDHLIIPRTKKINIVWREQSVTLLAEQRLDFVPQAGLQEELYYQYAEQMDTVTLQLTTLICKTGFDDVKWDNIPILEREPPFHIGLIDLEDMRYGAETGIFGGPLQRPGLINCLFSERLIDQVIDRARELQVTSEYESDIKRNRLAAIEKHKELLAHYETKGINRQPDQPLNVDVEALGLNLQETAIQERYNEDCTEVTSEEITLETFAHIVIDRINTKIQKTKQPDSAKKRRELTFSCEDLRTKGIPTELDHLGLKGPITNEEDFNNTWFHRIMMALEEQQSIQIIGQGSSSWYHIQA